MPGYSGSYSGAGGGGGGAPAAASFVTVTAESGIATERVLTGTSNQIVITDNGANSTLVLSTPQDIATGSSPTFAGVTVSGATASRLLATNGSKALASVADLTSWVGGTANQIVSTSDGDGTITLSTPQDIGTSSSVTFGNVTVGNAGALRTTTTSGHTLLIQAYDNDTGPGYTTFITLTAGNTPTCDLSTSVTMGGAAFYTVGGQDISVADGGTGLSSWTANSLVYASASTTLASLGAATNGQIPIGSTGAAPVLATITGTSNQITVGTGAGSITLSTPQDIATTSSPQFANLIITAGGEIRPSSDSTTAINITKTDGTTTLVTVDTTNGGMTGRMYGAAVTNATEYEGNFTATGITSAATSPPAYRYWAFRGTHTSPTPVQSGDVLGTMNAVGTHTSGIGNIALGAAMRFIATENWSGTNNVGANTQFFNKGTALGSGAFLTWTFGVPETVFNDASADIDLRFESNDLTAMFFMDAADNTIGIGAAPAANHMLDITDLARSTGTPFGIRLRGANHTTTSAVTGLQFVGGQTEGSNGVTLLKVQGQNQGTTTGQVDAESTDVYFLLSRYVRFAGSSGITTQRAWRIDSPLYRFASAQTITTATLMDLDTACGADTNCTITNSNIIRMGGAITIGPTAAAQTYTGVNISAHTVTVTGTTSVTGTPSYAGVRVGQITYTDASSVTIAQATGAFFAPPQYGGSLRITDASAILAGANVTMPAQTGTLYAAIKIPDHTFTTSGAVTIAGPIAAQYIGTLTLTEALGDTTVSAAAGLYIKSAPAASGAITANARYAIFVDAGVSRFDDSILIGATAIETGSTNTLVIANGTAPDNGVADTVIFYSSDNSSGNTIPSFFCEGTEVLATGQADSASATRVKVRINGTVVTLLGI